MESDAHAHRLIRVRIVVSGEGALDLDGTLESAAGALEGDHEAVALRLHLEAVVGRKLLANDGVVGS